ncbi:MAG: hypothetical protein ACI843_001568 [Psychrobacter glaciei]|jgi:hypothetical protein
METNNQYRADLALNTIKTLRNGRTQDEFSEQLNDLVQACRETNKIGEITLKIKVRPDKAGNGQYFLEDQITCNAPKPERGQTIYFGTPDGNLQRDDPNQQSLDLREVSKQEPANSKQLTEAPTQLKEVN